MGQTAGVISVGRTSQFGKQVKSCLSSTERIRAIIAPQGTHNEGHMRICVLGDSVPWGQGLAPDHKSCSIFAKALGVTSEIEMFAHSGAVIGAGWPDLDETSPGEVPVAYPTVMQQVRAVPNAEAVDCVLLTASLNDVNIRRLLNPLTPMNELRALTQIHCYANMRTLLRSVATAFTRDSCRFLITGYYPILSDDTDLMRIPALLGNFGISLGPNLNQGPILKRLVRQCQLFWEESEVLLSNAVDDANASEERNRFRFVKSPFSKQNAVFASEPWLFGLTSDFEPQDEVILERQLQCKVMFGEATQLADREQCYRASAGHPNAIGAQKIADKLIGVFNA